jgi:proline dehydrogenase
MLVAPLPFVPKPVIWRFSQRYVAGVDLQSAFDAVRELNALGCTATIDVLGEDSTTPGEVERARDLYFDALTGIESQRLACNASVKLSDIGLRFDRQLCHDVLVAIVDAAGRRGNFVRIDMEDASVTSATLDIYRRLRECRNNVGAVIQSCLRRSEADIQALLDEGIAHVRLCKGIYVEPADIAFTAAEDVSRSYRELLEQLFEGGAEKVGIATHDPALIEHAVNTLKRLGIDRSRYEFQMLLGVAEATRARLVGEGHPLRVYVPFGERWYAYSMRRLRENPGIAMHIVRNLFRRR